MLKVYVVMGNDFPECVFVNEEAAARFCASKKAEHTDPYRARIHWRAYELELRLDK